MTNKKTVFSVVLFIVIATIGLSIATETLAVTANAPKINLPIPDMPSLSSIEFKPGEIVNVPWIAQYLLGIYNYALIIASILAVFMLMLGGVLYLTAGGLPQNVKRAQSFMTGAVIGLVILMSSYMILYLINPKIVQPGSLSFETIEGGEINESEFAALPAGLYKIAGDLPYYSQTDRRWACFPFTGNECSHQVSYNDNGTKKSLGCGTGGTTVTFPGAPNPPEKGITSCRHAGGTFSFLNGQDYCDYIDKNWHVTELCNDPNVKNSAWCGNNPYGINNFVDYCNKVKATNKSGKATNLNNIQASGCGLTSTAMVASFYGMNVQPPDIATWIQKNALRIPSQGSSVPGTCCGFEKTGMSVFAKAHDMEMKLLSKSKGNLEVKKILKQGIPLIFYVSARNGKDKCAFTSSGHYITVAKYNSENSIVVHDPSPFTKSAKARGMRNKGKDTIVKESDIWDDCNVHDIIYLYPNGSYGNIPLQSTGDGPIEPSTLVTGGQCNSIPDMSPFNSHSGCYNSAMNCTPGDIVAVANVWGATNMITAPNSCARMTARILKNAGCEFRGAGGISSLKTHLSNLNWGALIIQGTPATNYSHQIPVGAFFACNNGGNLQHVYVSTGKGDAVESGTHWSKECYATGCPKDGGKTCSKFNPSQSVITKCQSNGYIENLNAMSGSPSGSCSTNQCLRMAPGKGKDATVVMFPPINETDTVMGCCKSGLIVTSRRAKGQNHPNGIKVNKATCDSLFGTWTPGGSCPKPQKPNEAIQESLLKSMTICTAGW
jgi:hypothetical protein